MASVFGLTGGIGSGKSTVSRLLASHGAAVVDADQVARELQGAGSPMVEAMVEAFGADIVDDAGNLNRAAVAELVFGESPEAQRNLALLNAITHPAIHEEISRRLIAAGADADVVVLDHPLLVERIGEGRQPTGLDAVIVVDVDAQTQLERLVNERGMPEDDARNRIASQATRQQRLAVADYVVDNSGDLDRLGAEVDELWQRLTGELTG